MIKHYYFLFAFLGLLTHSLNAQPGKDLNKVNYLGSSRAALTDYLSNLSCQPLQPLTFLCTRFQANPDSVEEYKVEEMYEFNTKGNLTAIRIIYPYSAKLWKELKDTLSSQNTIKLSNKHWLLTPDNKEEGFYYETRIFNRHNKLLEVEMQIMSGYHLIIP